MQNRKITNPCKIQGQPGEFTSFHRGQIVSVDDPNYNHWFVVENSALFGPDVTPTSAIGLASEAEKALAYAQELSVKRDELSKEVDEVFAFANKLSKEAELAEAREKEEAAAASSPSEEELAAAEKAAAEKAAAEKAAAEKAAAEKAAAEKAPKGK